MDNRTDVDNLIRHLNRYEKREGCGFENAVRDLLTDLRHVCAEKGIDFEAKAEGSLEVFREERRMESKNAKTRLAMLRSENSGTKANGHARQCSCDKCLHWDKEGDWSKKGPAKRTKGGTRG